MANFENKKGGVPFPRTAQEWIDRGLSPAQADLKVCNDVFGVGHKLDATGRPVESGRGSAANPVNESAIAREKEKSAAEQARMRLGWRKELETAFDPRSAA